MAWADQTLIVEGKLAEPWGQNSNWPGSRLGRQARIARPEVDLSGVTVIGSEGEVLEVSTASMWWRS
jgi:hypothetical protein